MTQQALQKYLLRTPFYPRTKPACLTDEWHQWKAYLAADSFSNVELEYFSIRNQAAVFDITPMSKYRVTGPDAMAYFNRIFTRDVSKLSVGRVGYGVWCNGAGRVIDDGTLFRLGENDYRLCSQERQLDWLNWSKLGFEVDVAEETDEVAALALQGPCTCSVLKNMGFDGIENLKPFGITYYPFDGSEIMISRTGFTGDLGYELWTTPDHAVALWDALFEAGANYHIMPIGTHALDMARIEAGFIQAGVDFLPANETVRIDRSRTPFELGLDWLVDLNKPNFNGRRALLEEKEKGSRFRLVKLDIEGNKVAHDSFIFSGKAGKNVGIVTSSVWSPILKANIALASLELPKGASDDNLYAEIYYNRELKWKRVMAACKVVDGPFFNPERRRVTPAQDH